MAKVLLAEDDVIMLGLLRTLLAIEGFEVAELRPDDPDVQTAILRERPDALLLDIHLPKQNGLDVLRTLRKEDATRHLRVIVASGSNREVECLSAGADGFLLKPYMPDDLIRLLQPPYV